MSRRREDRGERREHGINNTRNVWWKLKAELEFSIQASSWVAVRSVQSMEGDRMRFAHTSPWHIEIPGRPLHPRQEETDFLIGRVQSELERNQTVLPEAAMAEPREALRIYRAIAEKAR